MGREKALAFMAISFIATVFVLKTVSVLHSSGSLVQKQQRPVDTTKVVVRIPEVSDHTIIRSVVIICLAQQQRQQQGITS